MSPLHVRWLGVQSYEPVLEAMQRFTDQRERGVTGDEIWLLQHPPVFTQGQAGKAEHLLQAGTIPVVQADRGGQITYHGPGQLIGYLLLDIQRLGFGVRELVERMEQAIIALLARYQLEAHPRRDAPGVYLPRGAKIAQLGLRVRRGCSFHGLSLNVAMDLDPFQQINPCGYAGMEVTDMRSEGIELPPLEVIATQLSEELSKVLGYNDCSISRETDIPYSGSN